MTEKFIAILAQEGNVECLIINASNKMAAYQKFVRHYAPTDDVLNDHICDPSINMGLMELFWRDENGYFFDSETGETKVPIEYAENCARKNIREFFGNHKNFADLYLEYIDKVESEDDIEKCQFPDEMVNYIALNIEWYQDVTVIPISKINQI